MANSTTNALYWITFVMVLRDIFFNAFYVMGVLNTGVILAPVSLMALVLVQGSLDFVILFITFMWSVCVDMGKTGGVSRYLWYYAGSFYGEIWCCAITLYYYVTFNGTIGAVPSPTADTAEYFIYFLAYISAIFFVNGSNVLRWFHLASKTSKTDAKSSAKKMAKS
jgi:hypothetical protein